MAVTTTAPASPTVAAAVPQPAAPASAAVAERAAFDEALASAMQDATPYVPDLAPSAGPATITLAAALGLAPPIAVAGPPADTGAAGLAAVSGVGAEWKSKLPAAGRAWADQIDAAAARHGLDPRLLAALVRAESGFRPEARSHAGAVGLTQLMPATARGLGVDPYDPIENLDGGARYLKSMLDRFGSTSSALAAYNAGPGRVERAGGVPQIPETQAYVPKVLRYYEQLR